jgi:hypothetical protein
MGAENLDNLEGDRILKSKKVFGDWNPENVFVFDNETWGKNATKFSIGMVKNLTGSIVARFDDKMRMKNFLLSAPKGSVFYAHNAEYDMAGLFDINEFRNMLKIYPGKLICAFITKINSPEIKPDWNGDIQVRDSLAIFPMSLANLGASIGFEKLITPDKFIKGIECEITEEDWKYLERDCDILIEAINGLHTKYNAWINKENMPLPMTTASLAYSIFSNSFWPEEWTSDRVIKRGGIPQYCCPKRCKIGRKIYTPDSGVCMKCGTTKIKAIKTGDSKLFIKPNIHDIGLLSYAGGRTQVLGNPAEIYEDIYSYDINSLYPYVMKNYPYPSPKSGYLETPSSWKLQRLMSNSERLIIAKLMLNGENSTVKFLPGMDENKRRNYNLNSFHGYLCEPEIRAALDRGWTVEKVEELYTFEACNPFEKFVDFFYNLRLEMQKNDDKNQIFVKLVMNSLYGKFGQKDIKLRIESALAIDRITRYEDWWETHEIKDYNHMQGVYLEEKFPSLISENSFTPIAAFCTSYARVELLKAIEKTGAIYCDTDSIFTNIKPELAAELIPIGDKLGEWKMEKYCRFFQPWEPKVYRSFDENMAVIMVKHKGANLSDGDLRKPQNAEMMNKFRASVNNPKMTWGEFRIVEKKSKRFYDEK